MSWRNVAKTLEIPMSTVIDACQECSENPPKGGSDSSANTTPYLPSVYGFDKRVFSEHLSGSKRR